MSNHAARRNVIAAAAVIAPPPPPFLRHETAPPPQKSAGPLVHPCILLRRLTAGLREKFPPFEPFRRSRSANA